MLKLGHYLDLMQCLAPYTQGKSDCSVSMARAKVFSPYFKDNELAGVIMHALFVLVCGR
jgi:hypothetical protein